MIKNTFMFSLKRYAVIMQREKCCCEILILIIDILHNMVDIAYVIMKTFLLQIPIYRHPISQFCSQYHSFNNVFSVLNYICETETAPLAQFSDT